MRMAVSNKQLEVERKERQARRLTYLLAPPAVLLISAVDSVADVFLRFIGL